MAPGTVVSGTGRDATGAPGRVGSGSDVVDARGRVAMSPAGRRRSFAHLGRARQGLARASFAMRFAIAQRCTSLGPS